MTTFALFLRLTVDNPSDAESVLRCLLVFFIFKGEFCRLFFLVALASISVISSSDDSSNDSNKSSQFWDFVLELDLGLDSLDKIELALDVELKFNIDLPGDTMDKARTVKDLIDIVKKLVKRS